MPTTLKPYSFDNPAPGAKFWHRAQNTFIDTINNESARRTALGDRTIEMSIDVNISTHPSSTSAMLVAGIWPDAHAAAPAIAPEPQLETIVEDSETHAPSSPSPDAQ
eukprot:3119421-Prymnesium_polylepis.1